ncbi:hypothetical protein Bca52824_016266 [Brassica carinata]|uniref:DExH14 plug domain-containing protein n=1 Tax=Brassica carinata TaxID=52824 RepID=A0A8X7W6Q1_BRACI|nr:hypothetical protein Bca52824_016266 [Brassica carinata]
MGAVVELINREVLSKEGHEVAFIEYRLFGKAVEQEESYFRDQSPAKLKIRTTTSCKERSFSPTLSKRK